MRELIHLSVSVSVSHVVRSSPSEAVLINVVPPWSIADNNDVHVTMVVPLTPGTVHCVLGVVFVFTVIVSSESLSKRCRALTASPRKGTEETPRDKSKEATTVGFVCDEFRRFQTLYLVCVLICLAGDWLQGPYMYALYDAYGFSHDEIAALFVAGFGSSCVFGTFVGALADTIGRKRGALLYVVTYVVSCITKHWNSYSILMVGRVLGGISTSLLFSVFDSWVVSEHSRRGLDPALLSTLFANVQAGNSIVAILAGVIGEWSTRLIPMRAVDNTPLEKNDGHLVIGGFCTPFDLAAVVLVCGGFVIAVSWTENYGSAEDKGSRRSSVLASLKAGTLMVFRDTRVLLVGAIAALFEAAMYSFVFEWTPAVKASPDDRPPYGEIFSIMMLACMAGTRVYASYLAPATSNVANANVTTVFALSAGALAIPSALDSPFLCLLAFLVFEVAVGIYFPAIGVLKSKLIPDTHRATIYNLFRVPLNILVLAVLLSHAPGKVIFAASAVLLALASILHYDLFRRLARPGGTPKLADDDDAIPLLDEASPGASRDDSV